MPDFLGEALSQGVEIPLAAPTPDVAHVEQTDAIDDAQPDSSLTANESGEQQPVVEEPKVEGEQPEAPVETQAQLDFKALRTQKQALEADVTALRGTLEKVGGESQLRIMEPFLQVAMEVPRSEPELDQWSPKAWGALKSTLVPEQVHAMQTEATSEYTQSPQGQLEICRVLFGNGGDIPPEMPRVLAEMAQAYLADPTIIDILRPDETPESRNIRLAAEAKERAANERIAQLEKVGAETEKLNQQTALQQTMAQVYQVALAPRVEVKKQFGLEFQKTANDTPEIAGFKERASKRYDQITTLLLGTDPEMVRLSNQAEYLANQKDANMRDRAKAQFTPLLEQQTRKICAQVAKELAEDLKLFSPELSDQAKAAALKGLPAQVLGGGAPTSAKSGFDLTGMPDPINDPRGYANWVGKRMAEANGAERTPAILAAG